MNLRATIAGVMALWVIAFTTNICAADAAKMEAEGKAVALDILSRRPPEASTNTGALKLRLPKGKRSEMLVQQRIATSPTEWQNIYTAFQTNGQKHSILTITHSEQKPNKYQLELFGEGAAAKEFTGLAAMIPFAGTDFWLVDLGLEFLHWPTQRLLRKELRRGESCYVLESTTPETSETGYVRVVSWIKIDNLGIVHADAYDGRNKLLKEFEPRTFQKVNGQYELKSMEIRNEQTDTRTTIVFDLDEK